MRLLLTISISNINMNNNKLKYNVKFEELKIQIVIPKAKS